MALSDFSPEEQAVIEELKRRTIDCVTPMMLEDNYLFYRFAKARDFNLTEAESMLRRHLCWRKEFEIDTILTEYKPPKVLVKYVPANLICFDKEGCAVLYVDIGKLDMKGLWNSGKKQKLLQYFSYFFEQVKAEILKRNKKFGKTMIVPIFDFGGFTYSEATNMKTLQYCLYFLKAYVDNFPETLKTCFITNGPFYFIWFYAVLKQVLPPVVAQKIHIYGTDGWREDLLKLVDPDVLPAFLGGNKTDPDGNPLCNTFVKYGASIPKSYYMTSERKVLGDDFEKVAILPFSKKEISFEVTDTNSDLEWEYDVKSRDIDFSLHFKGDTLEPVELIPKQRTNTSYETEKGLFKCEKLGTYTLVLDNSYSWIHSKEVYFKAALKPPTEMGDERF